MNNEIFSIIKEVLEFLTLLSIPTGLTIYLISKIIIIKDLNKYPESQMLIIDGEIEEDYKTGEIYDKIFTLDESCKKLTLKSEKLIRYIKIYEMEISKNFKKGALVKDISFLAPPRMVLLELSIPCGIPNYIIEYKREDYMIATLNIQYNGRNGYTAASTKLKHTIKSILYHLTH